MLLEKLDKDALLVFDKARTLPVNLRDLYVVTVHSLTGDKEQMLAVFNSKLSQKESSSESAARRRPHLMNLFT